MGRRFDRATRVAAFARCQDAAGVPRCQECTAPLGAGNINYDHVIPWKLSHDSSIDNCQVLCNTCDDAKTYGVDLPMLARSDRVRDRHIGAVRAGEGRRPMPCGRSSRWSKPIGGFRPVRRLTQAQKLAATLARRRLVPADDAGCAP